MSNMNYLIDLLHRPSTYYDDVSIDHMRPWNDIKHGCTHMALYKRIYQPSWTPFADINYTLRVVKPYVRSTKQRQNLTEHVINSVRLKHSIKRECEMNEFLDERHAIQRAIYFLEQMRAKASRLVIRSVGYTLLKLLRMIFTQITVDLQQIRKIEDVSKIANEPVIYMPLHRSHMDYVMITWACAYHFNLPVMHVASGENLNLNGLGFLLRRLGAFFVRRRLDEDKSILEPASIPNFNNGMSIMGGRKDHIYRTVLQDYMEELLIEGVPIEFYPEGTRSRTGRAITAKAGLFSVLVDAYLDGKFKDAHIIPCSVTYDRLIEGSFANQLLGDKKCSESMWNIIKFWLLYLFTANRAYGSVRLNFGAPLSLRAELEKAQRRVNFQFNEVTLQPTFSLNNHYRTLQKGVLRAREITFNLAMSINSHSVQISTRALTEPIAALIAYKYHECSVTLDQLYYDLTSTNNSVAPLLKAYDHLLSNLCVDCSEAKIRQHITKCVQILVNENFVTVNKIAEIQLKNSVTQLSFDKYRKYRISIAYYAQGVLSRFALPIYAVTAQLADNNTLMLQRHDDVIFLVKTLKREIISPVIIKPGLNPIDTTDLSNTIVNESFRQAELLFGHEALNSGNIYLVRVLQPILAAYLYVCQNLNTAMDVAELPTKQNLALKLTKQFSTDLFKDHRHRLLLADALTVELVTNAIDMLIEVGVVAYKNDIQVCSINWNNIDIQRQLSSIIDTLIRLIIPCLA